MKDKKTVRSWKETDIRDKYVKQGEEKLTVQRKERMLQRTAVESSVCGYVACEM
jgi:hypothetical protein